MALKLFPFSMAFAAILLPPAPVRAATPAKTGECAAVGELSFLCGPQHPEDLVVLPGERWLIASGEAQGSGLHLVDAKAKTWVRWFASPPKAVSKLYPDCATPPAKDNFLAHGLSLRPNGKGRASLYVVNHGGRETIEVFDLIYSKAKPTLTWVGCVAMPEALAANSVTALTDGSLLATVFLHPGMSIADVLAGKDTGSVYEWRPGSKGFVRMPGTEMPGNNGIESSRDGKIFYVVSSGRKTVTAFTRTDPVRVVGMSQMKDFGPDNLHWYGDGQLVAAGMTDDEPACGGPAKVADGKVDLVSCARGYRVVLINPSDMKVTPFAEGMRAPPYTGVTTAAKAGGVLWLGSFWSDRLAYRPLP